MDVEAPLHSPRTEYTSRLESRRMLAARLDRRFRTLGNWRLLVAFGFAALAWFAVSRDLITPWLLLVPVLIFAALVILSERSVKARRRADRAVGFYECGFCRLDDCWAGKGEAGERFRDSTHPYAEDLDLFGKASLFELLCTARTRMGQDTLAGWLLAPAAADEIRARHSAVDELRSQVDVREDVALLGEDIRAGVNPAELAAWGAEPEFLLPSEVRIVAGLLVTLLIVSIAGWSFFGLPRVLIIIVLSLEALFAVRLRSAVKYLVQSVERPSHDLALLSEFLKLLESKQFSSPRLIELRRKLDTEGQPASRQIAKLNRLIELLDSRDHLLIRVIGPPLLWTTQLALAIEAWRKKNGRSVAQWLHSVGEVEALLALAGYAYEHPDDTFPEFTGQTPSFHAKGIGHPLLPETRSVRNDVQLDGDVQVMIVSGSNMSGKSTLLRTVGTNTVLAMAGAPVRAQSLLLSPLAVGASIRVMDSLQGGSSRFYAEITRLRQLVDITRSPLPLLFLLDELLHGTNSHDRRIGAEAVVRTLVNRGAIGMITTHDLALAHIAEALAPRGANVHFEDYIENSRISFDYRMRPGVVEKSNALELMRAIGLDV